MATFTTEELKKKYQTGESTKKTLTTDELKQKYAVSTPAPVPEQAEKKPTMGGNLLRGLLKTPARVATNVVQFGELIGGKKPEDLSEPFSGKYLGEVKPLGGRVTEDTSFSKPIIEGIGAGLETASYFPIGRATKVGVEAVKQPFKQSVLQAGKNLAREGAVGGGLSSAGTQLQEKGTINPVEVGIGSVLGGLAGGGLGAIGAGASRLLQKIPKEQIAKNVETATSKALGVSGKRPATGAIVQPKKMAEGLAIVRKYNPDIDIKGSDNLFDDTIKGLVKAKDAVFKSYDDIARKAGDEGIKVDVIALEETLSKYLKGITTGPKKARARRLLTELRSNFPDGEATPSQLQNYIQLLNEELGGVSGGAERGAVGVVSDFTRQAREAMETAISKAGKEYQQFRNDYASLKSIEDALVREYQKVMRKKGSGLSAYADMISNAEILSSVISANPALMAKGLAFKLGAKLIKSAQDPETYLRQAFEGIDRLYSR